jgi:hypothetical protein
VWHLRIAGKREKIRYLPLAIAAQRLTTQIGIAGTAPRYGVHAMRATAATNALEHGANIARSISRGL